MSIQGHFSELSLKAVSNSYIYSVTGHNAISSLPLFSELCVARSRGQLPVISLLVSQQHLTLANHQPSSLNSFCLYFSVIIYFPLFLPTCLLTHYLSFLEAPQFTKLKIWIFSSIFCLFWFLFLLLLQVHIVIVVVQLLICVQLFETLHTSVCQASPSFSSLGTCSNSCPLNWWWHPNLSS